MTSQSNSSQGRGHDRLPNWNPKNGGMLISQPISSCLTNHSELCMSRLLNNQSRRISVYGLQRRPSFGFESSVSSTPMTSSDPVISTMRDSILSFPPFPYSPLSLLFLLSSVFISLLFPPCTHLNLTKRYGGKAIYGPGWAQPEDVWCIFEVKMTSDSNNFEWLYDGQLSNCCTIYSCT